MADALEARNSAILAICTGSSAPGRHWLRSISALAASSTHSASCFWVMTQPGTSVLTRIRSGPNSRASALLIPCVAALLAAYTG